jgi:MoxR-like ATPase
VNEIQVFADRVITNVEKVILGQREAIELILAALLCEGHVLIEDVPGVGKTMMARAFAKSIGCTFKRIQFTPDLLPSDVTGVSIFNQKAREFEYRPGPIMAQIVLADEINRATPKTQSALLECMEEMQITVDGETHHVPRPFLVLATQNPIEYEGTFPLPEAQLDRFLVRLNLGYPKRQDEIDVLERQQVSHPVDELEQAVSAEDLVEAQEFIRRAIYVDPLIREYIVSIVSATRQHPDVYLGASPRGSLALFRTGQALAALRGRDFVIPDDVKALAEATLAHRIILNPAARIRNVSQATIVEEVVRSIPVPGAKLHSSPGD